MKKRILPALLALCMVISLLPVAFADGCTGSNPANNDCAEETHTDGCPKMCATAGCSKTTGHTDAHNNTTCDGSIKATTGATCGASEHVDGCGLYESDDGDGDDTPADCTGGADCKAPAGSHDNTGYGDENDEPCAKYVKCNVGGCDLDKGHDGNHSVEGGNIAKCLGYAADEKCSATTHIAGCPNYDCGCNHTHTDGGKDWDDDFTANGECTSAPGCPVCSQWNAFVTGLKAKFDRQKTAYDADQALETPTGDVEDPGDFDLDLCTCADCRPNPAMGVVTDESGNVVDPTDPAEPTDPTEPEAPKAEEFTDMEDWMAADVQVALDKGWLQGNGDGTFDGRGVTKGTTIAAALARMDGETITGADWDKDALAWAEGKDVFEGVELTGDSMARKDLVLVLWRLADKPDSEHELDFTDVEGLEGDHLTAMKWAVENGIVKGNGDGTVTPDGSVSRAALCAMLARYDSLEK